MTAILAFVLSPIGRWVAVAGVSAFMVFGAYTKGRFDGRASYKAKLERQINEAISTGQHGRADALRKLDADGVPNGWFKD